MAQNGRHEGEKQRDCLYGMRYHTLDDSAKRDTAKREYPIGSPSEEGMGREREEINERQMYMETEFERDQWREQKVHGDEAPEEHQSQRMEESSDSQDCPNAGF